MYKLSPSPKAQQAEIAELLWAMDDTIRDFIDTANSFKFNY